MEHNPIHGYPNEMFPDPLDLPPEAYMSLLLHLAHERVESGRFTYIQAGRRAFREWMLYMERQPDRFAVTRA